ncbi:MAG: hypothetical protein PHF29_02455 [Candidatus Riflebacteria bacterium]|nr:hypothetical protein [Candidatus Riflebacteria bacterium]
MPAKTILFLITAFTLSIFTGANAMTPRVTLPDWYQYNITVSEWNPEKGEVTIATKITALSADISDLSCNITPSKSVTPILKKNEKYFAKLLKKGENIVFEQSFHVKTGTSVWLDMAIRGLPDKKEMLALVNKQYANKPSMLAVMQNEVKELSSPVYIGKIMPLLLRKDNALFSVEETAPELETFKDGQQYYIWNPKTVQSSGFEAESLRAFASFTGSRNYVNAEKIGDLIISRMQNSNKPMLLEKGNGDTFMIPINVAKDLINFNVALLNALSKNTAAPIEENIKNLKDSDIKLMSEFNLATFYLKLGQKEKALEIFEKLRDALPGWQAVKEKIKEIR